MIAITGATGEVGGRIARLLAQAGHEQRLIVRDAARAPQFDAPLQVAEFGGYLDAEGMLAACEGVDTLFFASGRESADVVTGDVARLTGHEPVGLSELLTK